MSSLESVNLRNTAKEIINPATQETLQNILDIFLDVWSDDDNWLRVDTDLTPITEELTALGVIIVEQSTLVQAKLNTESQEIQSLLTQEFNESQVQLANIDTAITQFNQDFDARDLRKEVGGHGYSENNPTHIEIDYVNSRLSRTALGARTTMFQELVTGFKEPILQVAFADIENTQGIQLSDFFVVTTFGTGSATIVNGDLILSTGPGEDGGVLVESVKDIDYKSADEAVAFWTHEVNQPLSAAVQFRAGLGSGNLVSTPAGAEFFDSEDDLFSEVSTEDFNEDFIGIGLKGDVNTIYYRNGSSVVNSDIIQSQWNTDTADGTEDSKWELRNGTKLALSQVNRRTVYSTSYGYLGAIPDGPSAMAPAGHWVDFHKYEHSGFKSGRNFRNPSQKLRFILQKVTAGDTENYSVSLASASMFRFGTPFRDGRLDVAVTRVNGELEGQFRLSPTIINVTEQTTILDVANLDPLNYGFPAGTQLAFTVDHLYIGAVNYQFDEAVFALTDSGAPVGIRRVVPRWTVGSGPGHVEGDENFLGRRFDTSVRLDFIQGAGDCIVNGHISGWLEAIN